MAETSDAGVVRQLLSPLSEFLADDSLYEVVSNRPGEVLTEGADGWQTHKSEDLTYEKLMRLARAVASFSSQGIDETRPALSATLPGEERIQIVIPPATTKGAISITIRKPSSVTFSMSDLERGGLFAGTEATSLDRQRGRDRVDLHKEGGYREFFEAAVLARKNLIISSVTGSGKTTLSKAMIQHIPASDRILPAARRRRILLGPECNERTSGSITTVHADSASLAFEQLTLLVKESEGGRDLDRDDIRNLLRLSIDVIVQYKRVDGRFRVTGIYFDLRTGAPATAV